MKKSEVKSVIEKYQEIFNQEFEGENDQILGDLLRKYVGSISRCAWKSSQKWCKWEEEGPVLFPDRTRIYYRKGGTEIILQEFAPQVRILSFNRNLVERENSEDPVLDSGKNHHFSLALPYVIFIFKFVDGVFLNVKCAFSDRPLKTLEEKPLKPYLSNIDSTLTVCLGSSFDSDKLIPNQLSQQIAFILDYFWSSSYTDEWSGLFWENKGHFSDDSRLKDLKSWQEESFKNPLFVVEDVNWIEALGDSFGDMISKMMNDDKKDQEFSGDLYEEISRDFLEEVKNALNKSLESVEQKLLNDKTIDKVSS